MHEAILLGSKKEWNICSNMDGPRDYTKWNQTNVSLTCGIQSMIRMNLFTKQKKMHKHRKYIYGYKGKAGEEG